MFTSSPLIKSLSLIRLIFSINFNAAICFLLFICYFAIRGESQFFEYQKDLYGPMMGNLRLMLLYLCVTELAIYGFCKMRNNYVGIILLGIFFIMLTISIDLYGFLNQVPIDDHYRFLFFYLGLSHVFYGSLKLKSISDTNANS